MTGRWVARTRLDGSAPSEARRTCRVSARQGRRPPRKSARGADRSVRRDTREPSRANGCSAKARDRRASAPRSLARTLWSRARFAEGAHGASVRVVAPRDDGRSKDQLAGPEVPAVGPNAPRWVAMTSTPSRWRHRGGTPFLRTVHPEQTWWSHRSWVRSPYLGVMAVSRGGSSSDGPRCGAVATTGCSRRGLAVERATSVGRRVRGVEITRS